MELTEQHYALLDELGIQRDLASLSDDEFFRVEDTLYAEAMNHKTADGNSLTPEGEKYIDILTYMADI